MGVNAAGSDSETGSDLPFDPERSLLRVRRLVVRRIAEEHLQRRELSAVPRDDPERRYVSRRDASCISRRWLRARNQVCPGRIARRIEQALKNGRGICNRESGWVVWLH